MTVRECTGYVMSISSTAVGIWCADAENVLRQMREMGLRIVRCRVSAGDTAIDIIASITKYYGRIYLRPFKQYNAELKRLHRERRSRGNPLVVTVRIDEYIPMYVKRVDVVQRIRDARQLFEKYGCLSSSFLSHWLSISPMQSRYLLRLMARSGEIVRRVHSKVDVYCLPNSPLRIPMQSRGRWRWVTEKDVRRAVCSIVGGAKSAMATVSPSDVAELLGLDGAPPNLHLLYVVMRDLLGGNLLRNRSRLMFLVDKRVCNGTA